MGWAWSGGGALRREAEGDPPPPLGSPSSRKPPRAPGLPSATHLALPAACSPSRGDREQPTRTGNTYARVKHRRVGVIVHSTRVCAQTLGHITKMAGTARYIHSHPLSNQDGSPACYSQECLRWGQLPPTGSPPGASLRRGVSVFLSGLGTPLCPGGICCSGPRSPAQPSPSLRQPGKW